MQNITIETLTKIANAIGVKVRDFSARSKIRKLVQGTRSTEEESPTIGTASRRSPRRERRVRPQDQEIDDLQKLASDHR